MDASRIQRQFVAVMAKHLPPSSANLKLLDLDGKTGDLLAELRADLDLRHIPARAITEAALAPAAFDAVVAYDLALSDAVLSICLQALRAGGRLIALQSRGSVTGAHFRQLRNKGYVRILVEPALDDIGVLMRGEKAHDTANTVERIRSIASADANSLNPSQFTGRYIHLLVQQRPNKPVWKLDPGETITWRAAAIESDSVLTLLAFSSLPKAVAFLQPAVLEGLVNDVNKVGKFKAATAKALDWRISLNPALEALGGNTLAWLKIDPALAEAPDE